MVSYVGFTVGFPCDRSARSTKSVVLAPSVNSSEVGFRGGLTGYEMLDLLLTYMYLNILNSVEVNHHEQKWWFLLDDDKPVLLTHRIYICPYIYHKRQLNEGTYTSPMDGMG